MNLQLSEQATEAEATAWLEQLIRDFGPGFHPDTSPAQYVLPDCRPALKADEATTLEHSLARLFAVLGEQRPCEIGAVLLLSLMRDSKRRNGVSNQTD